MTSFTIYKDQMIFRQILTVEFLSLSKSKIVTLFWQLLTLAVERHKAILPVTLAAQLANTTLGGKMRTWHETLSRDFAVQIWHNSLVAEGSDIASNWARELVFRGPNNDWSASDLRVESQLLCFQ